MPAKGGKSNERLSKRVSRLLAARLADAFADANVAAAMRDAAQVLLPTEQRLNIDALISYDAPSSREQFLIQAAFGLCEPGLDLRRRQVGGRGVAAAFARLLKDRHIRATSDAFQNIGKNVVDLVRGNVPASDELLTWAGAASIAELQAAFDYGLANLALTARPVLPMPLLASSKLTFYSTARLFDALLDQPSGGAHEQFAVAACLEALLDEFGLGGIAGLRVDTKPLTASDASSRFAGDIQIKRGNRTEEVIEVSAADWRMKLQQAVAAIRSADARAHVIAHTRERTTEDGSDLAALGADVSVIDVRAFVRVLVAVMRRPARAAALVRLYEHLDRNQLNIDLVNAYVELIRQHGLVE